MVFLQMFGAVEASFFTLNRQKFGLAAGLLLRLVPYGGARVPQHWEIGLGLTLLNHPGAFLHQL